MGILRPRILFPLLTPGYFNFELKCHLFGEVFSDTPPPAQEMIWLAPCGSSSLTDSLALFPAISEQGPYLLYSWLHSREGLARSRFSIGIFWINEQISEATEDEAGGGKQNPSWGCPHSVKHTSFFPQRSFKKGHDTIRSVSEPGSVCRRRTWEEMNRQRRWGRQGSSITRLSKA